MDLGTRQAILSPVPHTKQTGDGLHHRDPNTRKHAHTFTLHYSTIPIEYSTGTL